MNHSVASLLGHTVESHYVKLEAASCGRESVLPRTSKLGIINLELCETVGVFLEGTDYRVERNDRNSISRNPTFSKLPLSRTKFVSRGHLSPKLTLDTAPTKVKRTLFILDSFAAFTAQAIMMCTF